MTTFTIFAIHADDTEFKVIEVEAAGEKDALKAAREFLKRIGVRGLPNGVVKIVAR